MKHHKTISRLPIIGTSALQSKLTFKSSLSNSVATGAETVLGSLFSNFTGFILNMLVFPGGGTTTT